MSAVIRSTLVYAIAGGLAALATLLFGVDRTDRILDAYLVFVSALLALAAARIAARAFPAPRRVVPAALARRQRRATRPESLRVIEDVVTLGQADNFDLHFQLRPVLQEIAADGLSARAGIDLYADSARAEEALSAPTWALVRPDRVRPEGGHVRGIDNRALTSVVSELERMFGP